MSEQQFTVVSFHAHPDDEALLTSGTLARAAADGHRVVIVVATAGEAGLARTDWVTDRLGERRTAELLRSAREIGAARVEVLGYPDSGWNPDAVSQQDPGRSRDAEHRGPDGPQRPPNGLSGELVPFSEMEVEALAIDLAALLSEESADVLTIYDENGGYGHADHVQVHRVGVRAAEIAGTPVVLEATVDRDLICRAAAVIRRLGKVMTLPAVPDLSNSYTARTALTHRVDVRRQLRAKVGSLRAHASQSTDEAGGDVRTLALLLGLPRPIRRRALRYEWFRERGCAPTGTMSDDIFASLRPAGFGPTPGGTEDV
jgi:LmbE family N-acetylglucosaminyl deacetylase